MPSWSFSVGNLVSRAAADPAAVAPAAADSLLPLANLGTGYPDEQGGLTWRSDGAYAVDFNLNLLAASSSTADAPTGWRDLLNILGGTPGLPANPPDWGNYGGRNPALRLYRPVVQYVDVMPGEAVKLNASIRWPAAAAGATGIQVRVVDLWSGKGWNGSAWVNGGVLETQLVADTWEDITEQIDADPSRAERCIYAIIIEPVAAAYGATTYCYASLNAAAGSPALIAEVDTVALIGHNLPAEATVVLTPTAGAPLGIQPRQPSCYATTLPQLVQTWRLSIQMPTGNQPRPILGEVWIGKSRTLAGHAPTLPYTLTEGDASQVRVEGTGGRVDVLGSGTPARAELMLSFSFDAAAYRQGRDEVARLTSFGEEPLLLLPSSGFEGAGRLYHGRLGQEVAYSRLTPPDAGDDAQSLRTFTWEFSESPLAAP